MTLKNLALLGLIVGAVAWYSQQRRTSDPTSQQNTEGDPLLVERPSEFRCEGKTRCSQMSSCEEATFYLENCSGVELDGDRDDIPCESQHCGH